MTLTNHSTEKWTDLFYEKYTCPLFLYLLATLDTPKTEKPEK